MNTQYIELGNQGWYILVYYNADYSDRDELYKALSFLDCPVSTITKALKVLKRKNIGFTFTNSDYKMSIVCIGEASSRSQFVSTVVHEAKHVQSHICSFYDIDEDSEEAAYLIGYIAKRMYIGIINVY